jgi:hypothetical protein
MLWLVPHLFADARLLEVAAHGLQLPGLQTLLARGTHGTAPAAGTEAALCDELGIARQSDCPWAPLTLEADGIEAGAAYWLRADPACFQLMRDRIVLAATGPADLTPEDAHALADAIGRHFGAALPLLAPHPQRGYLRFPVPLELVTTPPSLGIGRAVDTLLPSGRDAAALRVQLNELQMLLHAHPVNEAREARGCLPVNGLWVWGGGVQPAITNGGVTLYAENDEVRAFAHACRAHVQPLPARLDVALPGTPAVLLLDTLAGPACMGDAFAWRAAMLALEENWFAPLARDLRRTGNRGLRIVDPVNGRGLALRPADAWKFWRRPRDLLSRIA